MPSASTSIGFPPHETAEGVSVMFKPMVAANPDHKHAIQVRLLGGIPMVLDTKRMTFYEFAGMPARRSRSRYIRVATSGRRSGHLIVAGEMSVSAYKERHAKNSCCYSSRGICRIYCDARSWHDVARVGAAAV